jgi:adenosylmethionine-8-amino-7-oxononanoate aminotransferase
MDERTQQLIDADRRHLWHPFTQMAAWAASDPLVIESGEGFELIDTEGRRYIDGVSSLWCNVHGHRAGAIDGAIREQLDRVAHSTLLGLGQTRSIELAGRLVGIAPPGLTRVFYSDSGATAVEIAVKMAYQYWYNRGANRRTKFVALRDSYHGDTVGSVSIGGIELFHGIFHSLLFETFFIPTPHPYRFDGTADQCLRHSVDALETLLQTCGEEVAAVVVEPRVQGAAGMIVHPAGFLKAVRELTQKHDTLLIVDEVATGFGRTGTMFACEQEQVCPDLLCLAKGLTGGYLPLAATLATEKIFDAFLGTVAECKTFYHGHTYTGNALACAAAIASLDLFEQNKLLASLPEKIRLIAEALRPLGQLEHIGDIRQCGMMVGIEIVRDKRTKESFPFENTLGAKLCMAMRPKGAILRPLGDCIVLMPAPGMDKVTLQRLLDIVVDTVSNDLPRMIREL